MYELGTGATWQALIGPQNSPRTCTASLGLGPVSALLPAELPATPRLAAREAPTRRRGALLPQCPTRPARDALPRPATPYPAPRRPSPAPRRDVGRVQWATATVQFSPSNRRLGVRVEPSGTVTALSRVPMKCRSWPVSPFSLFYLYGSL